MKRKRKARTVRLTRLGERILRAIARGKYKFAPSGNTGNPAGTRLKDNLK